MNQIFTNATPDAKLYILEFLKEESMSISFHFKKEDHGYFKDKYPKLYEYFLLGADGDIHLIAFPKSVIRENNTVKLLRLEYHTGDAEAIYDDSSVQKFTCPAYPNGVEMDVPIDLIEGITPFREFKSG